MGSQDWKAYRRRSKRSFKMDHVSVLGTYTHVGHRLVVPHRLTYSYQKPYIASAGIFLQGWYREGVGDRHAAPRVHFGWPHRERERSAMGRWRAQWQRCAIHGFVRSHGPYLGCEWCTFSLESSLSQVTQAPSLGQAAPHVERPRTLGDHTLPKYRLCSAYWSLRSYREATIF